MAEGGCVEYCDWKLGGAAGLYPGYDGADDCMAALVAMSRCAE